MNDLWKYDGSSWTWISGSTLANQVPDYGAQNVPGPTPGGLRKPGGWLDANGDFWLFSGYGIDSTNTGNKDLNDLWKFRY